MNSDDSLLESIDSTTILSSNINNVSESLDNNTHSIY